MGNQAIQDSAFQDLFLDLINEFDPQKVEPWQIATMEDYIVHNERLADLFKKESKCLASMLEWLQIVYDLQSENSKSMQKIITQIENKRNKIVEMPPI